VIGRWRLYFVRINTYFSLKKSAQNRFPNLLKFSHN